MISVLTSKELALFKQRQPKERRSKGKEKGLHRVFWEDPNDLIKRLTALRILKNWGVIRKKQKKQMHTQASIHSHCKSVLYCQNPSTFMESAKDCEC